MNPHTPPRTHAAQTKIAALAIAVVAWALAPAFVAARQGLPEQLTDQEFWRLSEQFSEPNGSFRSDNLVSNELAFPSIIPGILARVKPGGVYMGVGPEQNFHYITAIRPKMAFITDVRRGNLHLHLMYKALFELSADRAEFVSRLLTKKRSANLGAKSTAAELMNTYWDLTTSDEAAYKANLQAIDDQLVKRHGLPLSKDDLDGSRALPSSLVLLVIRSAPLTLAGSRSQRARFWRKHEWGTDLPGDVDRWPGKRQFPRDRAELRVSQGLRDPESPRAGRG